MNKERLQRILTILKTILERLKQILFLIKPEQEVRNILISELTQAMATFEGWNIPDSLCRRNHNPCNLRWSKYQVCQKNDFAYFANDEAGWKGAEYDICCKCQGYTSTGLNSNSTLRDLIYVWTETDRYAYLMFVATKLKITFDYKLKNFICSIKL